LRAFYGTAEYTKRGQLHGHFLIWLDGALSPTEVHNRMWHDDKWKEQFFRFFEDIIHHHAPDVDAPDPKADWEPRAERPPDPRHNQFEDEMRMEVKCLAEKLQRHECRAVCFDYGHKECRFLFPHDIVESSYFDDDTNSIYFRCADPTLNYFNPYLLVFCCHNHDIKCILSGKSAKAAMFYISDYIMKKNDEKMYQVMTLFSKAVAAMPVDSNDDPSIRAKCLLHRCISALLRKQEIHAQQAVCYMRNKNDGMSSHLTVPMLSGAVLSLARKMLLGDAPDVNTGKAAINLNGQNDLEDSDDDCEPEWLKVGLDESGELYCCNQIDDYGCRDPALSQI
jgi:hypothetical protein